MRDEVEDDLPASFGVQVDHDRLLVAVDGPVQHRRVPGVQPPVTQLVAGYRALDLDDLGAEVGEHAACRRGGDVVAEFEDADTLEWRDAVVVR